MVYLAPPFHIIEGVSIFTDHSDPLQFYYLPLMPKLTTVFDPVTGVHVPQIQLIKYRGEAGGGGFLNFDCNLGIEEDKLDEIRRKLRNHHDLDDEPRLAPVPFLDGSVKLLLLGRDSSTEIAEAQGDEPQFVEKIAHHSKPSLYGSNQAAFSVQLDEAGVAVVEKSLQGEMAPIGVVYSLQFLALRPAYRVKLKADWERVQTHLQESLGTKGLFYSASIDKVVDELIESRVIEIEIDSFIPTGEDASAVLGRLDQAVNEVKDMVLENFFEPSLDPIREEEDGWDKAAKFAERASLLAASGGWSGLGGFTMKKVDITRIDKKSLNVSMSERTTVTRTIYPQGHLKGLFRILRDTNTDLSRFIIPVDIDDDWFRERRVRVIARTNFSQDNVESVNVNLRYNGQPQNVILDINAPEKTVRWNSAFDASGRMIRKVEASYQVAFKDADSTERPLKLNSEPEVLEVENYELRPTELFATTPISVMALDFPWELYPFVEVQLLYEDLEQGIRLDQTYLLSEQNSSETWRLFQLDATKNRFKYRCIYRAADHRDIEMPWAETDAEQVIIRDPYPEKRTLSVFPSFNWQEVDIVFMDVVYEDKENGIRESHALSFSAGDNGLKTLEIKKFVDVEQRLITFKTSVIYKDGRFFDSPSIATLSERVVLRPNMKGHKIVAVQPEAIPFEQRGLDEIEVELKYEDSEAGLSFAEKFKFESHEEEARYFEYDFDSDDKEHFQYQVCYIYLNGMVRHSEWKTHNDEVLLVPTK